MYASNWIFTLFTSTIPNSISHNFLDEFFKNGWPFFYRFTLTLLKVLSSRILSTNDDSEILELIKDPTKTAINIQNELMVRS